MTKVLTEYKDTTMDVIENTMQMDFQTLGKAELLEIAEGMVDVRRNMNIYGRRNSQVTSKLMSLTMLKLGFWSAIKQCDAQINTKYNAVKENYFRLEKKKVTLAKYEQKLNGADLDKFQRQYLEIEVFKIRTELHDVTVHIEHSYKEILMYQRTKKEIMEANGVREDFDEADFLEAEVKENLMTAFQHALRDIMVNGMANHGTLEYLEQFGVNPVIAYAEAKKYLSEMSGDISIESLYRWYDEMYNLYKDEYKHAMKRLGIKELVTEDAAYKNPIRETKED